jgi:hypothetical protein
LPHCQNQKTRKFCKRNYAGLKVAQLELWCYGYGKLKHGITACQHISM